jgi:hypothetical protein
MSEQTKGTVDPADSPVPEPTSAPSETDTERQARRAARNELRETDAARRGGMDSRGWLIGLVVSIVSIVLSAVLWSSRRL